MDNPQQFAIKTDRIIVDPRTVLQKCWDGLAYPAIPLAWAVISTIITAFWAGFIPFAFFVFGFLWLAVVSKPDTPPIHLPIDADKIDKNDPKPGENSGYYNARGSFFIGRIRKLGFEVWVNFKALTQHFLIFGTTGAGKTESLVSYIVNFLAVGSGVAFQDAKAAPKAMLQLATFCRIFARDCEFRVTNYITGLSAKKRDPAERVSNDAAVFATGNAESNTNLLVSLMPPSSGDNKIFGERAVALVAAEMPALTDLRELGKLQIDPGVIRRYMSFKAFASLFRDNNISKRSRDALQAYLESLPGYDEKKDINDQPEEVTRQFGFAQAYFTRSLASLSDTYGHIYLVGQGEIDYQDAVLNGRILLTLLPSMEKSGEELANLGKIVLTATKNGMVVGLGTVFEGSVDDIVHNLPTNSEIPYGIMNDENAYMLIEGQEIMNAQARGLGFGIFTGTQDAPGMLLNIEKTTKQIFSNSAFKQFMYIDDKDTTDLAVDLAGEASFLIRNQYERIGDMGNHYAGPNASLDKKNILTPEMIKQQKLGQAYVTYQGKMHAMQVFNHGIQEKHKDPRFKYISHWYSCRLAKVKVPTEQEMAELIKMDPRPEWRSLADLLTDNAQTMQRDMTCYFQSQLAVQKIAQQYAANSEMFDMTAEIFAARSMLAEQIEPATGLLGTIVKLAPRTPADSLKVLVEIAQTSTSGMVALQNMANEADLDSILAAEAAGISSAGLPEDDAAGKSSTGGSTGGMQPKSTPTKAPDSPLDAFLETDEPSPHPAPKPNAAAEIAAQVMAEHPIAPPRPMTDVAMAVEKNLDLMPWMSSQVEYDTVRHSLIQAQIVLTGDTQTLAEQSADADLAEMASTMQYPKTKYAPDENSRARVRSVLQSWTKD
ncbi:hypothetical protein [Pseudomonas aeruginosa]|uniref:hypothetical protein n=1 Tax=Pseudomonas aeruginosa TaxID=287 RepID=UPI001BFF0174|nr:hypothetical protein [Pseudomonas aeruginosa]MBT9112071.1 hypothetical protein [Pseudomonas aeruginosa]